MNAAHPSTRNAGRTVAILCHASETPQRTQKYAVHGMAEHWRAWGIQVQWLFGPSRGAVPADLVLVHVDLSVVPDSYLHFASGYPVALNARIGDIRKRTVCGHLVQAGDGWAGEVIVKSNLNFAGRPERRAGGAVQRLGAALHAFAHRWRSSAGVLIRRQEDYQVFATQQAVPRICFEHPEYVVQRFLPEREGDLYHVRSYSFLGDRFSCMRIASRQPIVHLRNAVRIDAIEPHAEIVAERHRLGLDYGKLDYVLHEGRAVLIDVNKTLGATPGEQDPITLAMRRERARGIFGYLGLPVPVG